MVQTVKGSVSYFEHLTRQLARMRNLAPSPGGTWAAALYYLKKAGVRAAQSDGETKSTAFLDRSQYGRLDS